MMPIVLRALGGLAVLALVTACASTLEANMDYDQQFDFSKVRKIAIQPVDRTGLSIVSISDMQVQRIDEALAQELQRKGFEIVSDNSEADVFLTWHLVTEERTDVRTYNSMSYYNCWGCGPAVSDVSVRQYTQGTFIVDMIDPMRNQSVWRSIIESRLRPEPDPEKAGARREEAAAAIFAQFPPA
ncbi:DUF4136 domain-containing protein [Pseudohalioglobus lutimaris]|uniref:DUF4136 domain-containing protein n=1 Tax=Pseudohalioglobus lutimaris TaxID=1737061 RepID=A0A2N5X1J3_9GAMM|nr:DUF4136 domain-containing protein [Pseudohalioglobus lutimaris]PLW68367.1 DUF4136 domain-containing protein [Pseudohalioglobus lutimaris]